MTIDVHQHLWPEPFLAALRARCRPPRLEGWTLHLEGEPPYAVDPAAHDPDRRAALDEGLEAICIAPSAALGIDRLPGPEAEELADAWLEGALALGDPFRAWATAPTLDPDALRDALDRGALGLELPADALAAPGGLDRLGPVLDVLDAAQRPLLVHPGPPHPPPATAQHPPTARPPHPPALGGPHPPTSVAPPAPPAPDRPTWWAPVVPYVTQLHAAWWAWADGGRERFPRLPVCFAALAGLGPLHGERHRSRGGRGGVVDPLTFVETSTYGTQAVDAVVRVLGIDVVCHGSDRPYAVPPEPALDASARHAIHTVNPGRLLAHALQEVPAR